MRRRGKGMPVALELLRYARARFGEGWQGSASRRRKTSEDEFTPFAGATRECLMIGLPL